MELVAIAGTAISAVGTLAGGAAAQRAANFKAQQEEKAAMESRAVGQREAMEKRRETGFLQSKLQARAAASGGGADDPTVIDLHGDIAERGEYEALAAMYRGENRARGQEDQATASRMTGDAAMTGAMFNAAGSLFKGASSARRRYDYGYA